MEWINDTDDSQKALEVLDRLQPHRNLEQLTIINYGGTRFLNWVGHGSFSHMVEVELLNCKNCCRLPSLGQLPHLKKLNIVGFYMVERIIDEFYSSNSASKTKPFKLLERLRFSNMSEWKEWLLKKGDREGGTFSQLKSLELIKCPKVSGACLVLGYLPSLTSIRMSECQQLVPSLQSDHHSSLDFLKIGKCPDLKSFPDLRLPSNLHTIKISNFEKLESFSEK